MDTSEIHRQIRQTTRRFADEAIGPIAERLAKDESSPAQLYQKMGELGLFGITVPEEFGGVGLDVKATRL